MNEREDGPIVDPTAVVAPGASVGARTRIWHFCHVMAGARIGRDCVLGHAVFVASGAILMDRVRVQNHVSVYEGVVVEDDVFIGPSCVFTNVRNPRAPISRRGSFERTVLRRGCTLGANATVVCGLEVGRYALVGAGAVVTRSVADHALVVGVPARPVGWVSRRGWRLSDPDEQGVMRCPESGEGYVLADGRVQRYELAGG